MAVLKGAMVRWRPHVKNRKCDIVITKNTLLRLMYWYNIVVTGGFALIIFVATLFPDFGRSILWKGFDPIVAGLCVPHFIVIAVFCARSLAEPEKGKTILLIQVWYKPFSIALVAYFTATGAVNPFWGWITIAGLVVYIAGNITAFAWKDV
jgi:hypothetical protein